MLHLSEIHRVTGRTERSAELVHEAVDLLRLHELSPEDVDALAPVTCHAFFCLGALAYWEGRPDEARPLLSHAWSHGGDSIPHLWSIVNHALVLTDDGDHEAALAFENAAIEMADRLGDGLASTAGPQQPRLHAAPPGPLRRGVRRVRRRAPRDPRRRHPRRGAHQLRGLRVRPVRHGSRPGRGPAGRRRARPSATASAFRAWRSRRPPSRRPSRPAGSGSATSGSPCSHAVPSSASSRRSPRRCDPPSSGPHQSAGCSVDDGQPLRAHAFRLHWPHAVEPRISLVALALALTGRQRPCPSGRPDHRQADQERPIEAKDLSAAALVLARAAGTRAGADRADRPGRRADRAAGAGHRAGGRRPHRQLPESRARARQRRHP